MASLSELSIQFIKGVGPQKKKLFEYLGVNNIEDLLYFFPRKYEDRREITPISQLKIGETQAIIGQVSVNTQRKSFFNKKHVTEIILDDKSAKIFLVWFNQPYLDKYFRKGVRLVCYGKVDLYKNRIQMVSPEYEIIDDKEELDNSLSLKRIVPMYSLAKGITQRQIRKIIKASIDKFMKELIDELPDSIRSKYELASIESSILNIHFPGDFKDQQEALKRISFEEFFFYQVSIILRRLSITKSKGISHNIPDSFILKFINSFAFEFTAAQKRVIKEISDDMKKAAPMLRLVQGDVGCGKTIVAIFGCLAAIENRNQAAIMVPTEILAYQHFNNINDLIKSGKFPELRISLLVSGLKKSQKDQILSDIESGAVDLVVGTHALISDNIKFKKLSFCVIDEQHKFGVRQRSLLAKKGINPDVLIMTATPIPRTLCITLYGDLDISIIDELPKGRLPVVTKLFSHENAKDAYFTVRQELKQGRQAYCVYPIIEESEKLDLKAAQDMYMNFKNHIFKEFKVGLIHGQMKQEDSDKVMSDFKSGKVDILVSTTVIEVGVDVSNSCVMVIEHAERFGLSQLHQLRGRVGRGQHQGVCVLVSDPVTDEGKKRLAALLETNDGFKIAQQDLLIRGPGSYFGRHQHGLNELKVANPATQLDLLENARKEAIELINQDSNLNKDEQSRRILATIKQRYPNYLSMIQAG